MINYAVSAAGYPVYHVYKADSLIVEAQILTKCGSAHEDSDSYGVAHFLEHLAFQGTPTKDKHKISREMALIGNYNAYTDYFRTNYHFDTLNEYFEKGFEILKESVFDSSYPEYEFEKEKRVIIEEWRMYDNYPSNAYDNFCLEKYFGLEEGHPIIGTQESIEGMNPEKLHRFRNKWYGKQNIAVIIVGGVTFEHAMEVVNKYLPPPKDVQEVPECLKHHHAASHSFETDRFDQAIYGLVQPWVNAKQTLEQNNVPTFMLRALSTYLYEYIRDDLGLCYGVSQSKMGHYDKSYLFTTILTNKDNLPKAEAELFKSYNKIKEEGFPEEIFNIAKRKSIYSLIKGLQGVSGIGSSLNSLITNSKDPDWILNQGSLFMDEKWLKQKADNLTPKDLQDCAVNNVGNYVSFSMIPVKK